MNCPKNVVPAVCVGLFGLLALRLGSLISSAGVLFRLSFASSRPPFLPRSVSEARTPSVAGANAGRSGNKRPNVVGLVDTVALRAATARGAAVAPTAPDNATAPAPTPARFRKAPLLYRDGAAVLSTLVTVVSLRHRLQARRPCGELSRRPAAAPATFSSRDREQRPSLLELGCCPR